MKLSEIFDQLAYGELSQLSLVDPDTGLIAATKYGQVVSFVNLGLTALYKRFPLKENQFTFALAADQLAYILDSGSDTVFTAGGEDGEEFNDDILKVERVYASSGSELSLNDESDPLSCFTPKATLLRVPALIVAKSIDLPSDLQTDTLKVVYRAKHPTIIKTTTFNPARVEVELPDSHLEPLLLFIASRATTPLGVGQFEGLAGNNYYSKFLRSCEDIEHQNLKVDQGSQNTRLQRNGWA